MGRFNRAKCRDVPAKLPRNPPSGPRIPLVARFHLKPNIEMTSLSRIKFRRHSGLRRWL